MAYIFTEKDRADAIDSEEIRNDFSGFKKIKRLLSFDLREMIGEMKTNPNLNLSLGSRGVKPTLILAMVDNARKSAPSMIGASLGDDKNSDNFYMLKYAAEHPWKALWDIAWPTKFTLNKYDALLIPLLLRFTNYLFYGVTTYLEFGLRNLGAFLLKPLSLVLFGKFDDFNDEPVTLAGWARVVLFCTGIPLVLGFIGQTFIFVANTLRHVRLAIDSVTNFCTSLIRIFSDDYGIKFPTLKTCVVSFLKNLPALMFDAFLIAACLIPGGQIASLLSSVGAGPIVAALSNIFAPIFHGPMVAGLGNAFASFFSLATNAMGMALGSLTVASTVASMGNVANAVFETTHTFVIFPIANGIQKWWNKRKEKARQEYDDEFNIDPLKSEPEPSSPKPVPRHTDAQLLEEFKGHNPRGSDSSDASQPIRGLSPVSNEYLDKDAYQRMGTFAQPSAPNELPLKSEFSLSHSADSDTPPPRSQL